MKNSIKVVTSFHVDAWGAYAKRFIESFKHWPKKVKLYAYYHDGELPEDAPRAKNIFYRNLMHDKEMLEYRDAHTAHDGTANGSQAYNWRMDAIKWCHKVYAMTALASEMRMDEDQPGWLIWLDADTCTTKSFPAKELKKLLPEEVELVHLGRKATDYSETSFLAFNLNSIRTHSVLLDLRGIYNSGEVITFREWHDGFIFERLLNLHKAHGLRTLDLSPDCEDLQAFNNSALSKYMRHFKGPAKERIQPAMRYNQLIELVSFYKPKSLLETGTWNGKHSLDMCRAALLSHESPVHYTGYDLFEDGSEELDKEELNSKSRVKMSDISPLFDTLADQFEGRFTYRLVKGNTRKTLKYHKVDFAFIDGGHSIETTRNDYEHLEGSKVIVFDDYFKKDKAGYEPKEEHQGTNKVFDTLKGDKWVLPSQDMVLGGGITHLAILVREGGEPPNKNRIAVPIVVNPIDCVDKEEIYTNIDENLKLIDTWLGKKYHWHRETALVCSGGPSLSESIQAIKKEMVPALSVPPRRIICVKHSYPVLLREGIVPWGCIILDPRPLDGTSTHGVVRKKLFENFNDRTIFFVASMTEPSVTKFLLEKGARIIGWHAFSQAVAKQKVMENKMLVTGGTCAAMRSVGLFHTLGFRDFKLYGFDSCLAQAPSEKEQKLQIEGRAKFLEVNVGSKTFWTTGELLAQAQDFEKLVQRFDVDLDIDVLGSGMIPELWKLQQSKREKLQSYTELLDV
tara:strand:- start:18 stop:2228 length:2211 start_codon:yes stop_codon:yes gene_type:complete